MKTKNKWATKLFALAIATSFSFAASAQESSRSPFRKGYLRIGVNSLGNQLDDNLSPKDNILAGNYGSGTGYVFETGRVYYFKKPKGGDKLAVGLDWTTISASYNALSKWEGYANRYNGSVESPFSASLSTRLGPIVSFNVVENLVIDARVQLAAGMHYYKYSYYDDEYYFELLGKQGEVDDEENVASTVSKMAVFGIKPSFGFSIRRKAIGLALDYAPGKIDQNYEEQLSADAPINIVKTKIKTDNLQLKLTFSF